MDGQPPAHKPEPAVIWLILRGLLMIVGAFYSAYFILIVHTPSGH